LEPGLPETEYRDAPFPADSNSFAASGLLSVAASCPCSWGLEEWNVRTDLADRTLLLPQHICAKLNDTRPTCTPELAACLAQRFNASGVIFACDFARLEESEFDTPGQCLTQTADSYCGFPAVVVLNNVSLLLATAAALNYTQPDAPTLRSDAGDPPSSDATSNATAPPPPPLFWVLPAAAAINVALTWEEEDGCTIYRNVPYVYLVVVPVWWFLTTLWAWNTYRRNLASARDLHRLLCWVPTLQFINGVLSLFYFSSCPWKYTIDLIYAMLWAVVTILKEPVILLCLLLVAKGWCITRNNLNRREVCMAGSTVALLYAAISIQLSMSSLISLVPMVIMYLVMLIDIAVSIYSNLRVLKAQLLVLRSFGIDPSTTPVHRKYIMFVRLAKGIAVYTLLEIALHTSFPRQADESYWLFVALHSLMEILVAVVIGYTFRAQPLNVHFQQVQQVAAELAEQLLPSITTVEVKPETFSGEGLVAWRPDLDLNAHRRQGEPQMPSTILVLNPGDIEVHDTPAPRARPTRQAPRARPTRQAPVPAGADEPGGFINRAMRRASGGARRSGSATRPEQEMSAPPEG
jgi:hypothetical protein